MLAGAALLLLARVPFNASEIARLGRYALIPTWVYVTVWPMDDLIDGLGYPITSNASEVLHDRLSHRLQRVETKIWLMRARGRIEAGHAAELSHIQVPIVTRVFDVTGAARDMLDTTLEYSDEPDEIVPKLAGSGLSLPRFFPNRTVNPVVLHSRMRIMQQHMQGCFIDPLRNVMEKCEEAESDSYAFAPMAVSIVGTQLVITTRATNIQTVESVVDALDRACAGKPGERWDVKLPSTTLTIWNVNETGIQWTNGLYFSSLEGTRGDGIAWCFEGDDVARKQAHIEAAVQSRAAAR